MGVVPAAHPLAQKAHLCAADFQDETLLVFSDVLERGQEVETLFEPAGILPHRVLSAGNARFVCALVANNVGLGILGKWAVTEAMRRYDLKPVRLTPDELKANWYAATGKDRAKASATTALLSLLKQAFR